MALIKYRSSMVPVLGLILSIIGLVYVLVMSVNAGREALCLTSGCTVVSDFKIFGISPWWAAALIFAAITVMCVLRMRLFAKVLASAFLFGDCIFLIIMFFIAPCTNCLGAALIIFATWAALRLDRGTFVMPRRILAGTLGGLWAVLFILNLGYAISELPPTWGLQAQNGAEKKISIFFSPSCPACREAVNAFSDNAVFYPVAENEADYAAIADMTKHMQEGLSPSAALDATLAAQAGGDYIPPDLSLWQHADIKMKVMRNQAQVLRMGGDVLPVIVFKGLPQSWAKPQPDGTAASGSGNGNAASDPAATAGPAAAPARSGPEAYQQSRTGTPAANQSAVTGSEAENIAPEATSPSTENVASDRARAVTESLANEGASQAAENASTAGAGTELTAESPTAPEARGRQSAGDASGPDLPLNVNETLECGRGEQEPCAQ